MTTVTDADGVWMVKANGRTRYLIEPSQAWLDARDEANQPSPEEDADDAREG